ncbi:MAG: DUF5690 family protein [Pirellulales bacterium]
MQASKRPITRWLENAPTGVFVTYAIIAAFSTYFCMYAFRKPFAAAEFSGQTFFDTSIKLKTTLVISQIIGYAISKYIGIKVCSEVKRERRSIMLVGMILWALAALVLYGFVPDRWKFVAIFMNGLPLGMIWGLVVWYLEGRTVSELLLAGLSCSYIVASGVVKDVGRRLMDVYGISEGWMPAATGAIFLLPFFIAVWLLNQIPKPTDADEVARTHREPMDRTHRLAFVRQFFWGLLLLLVAFFFLTAYRDYRDNYQVDIYNAMEYSYEENKTIITQSETIVAFGVMVTLGLLFLIKDNWYGLIATYGIMTTGLVILGGSTYAMQNGMISGFWWMTLVGFGAYLAYVPYGSVLFDRLIATTNVVGTAVFAIYIMDAVGYTGSVFIQIYNDLFYNVTTKENIVVTDASERLAFFIDFSYFMSGLALILMVSSCIYFLSKQRTTRQKAEVS